MQAAKFLVKVNGKLWGYDTPAVLRIDIALNRKNYNESPQEIFELVDGVVIEYKPIDELELAGR